MRHVLSALIACSAGAASAQTYEITSFRIAGGGGTLAGGGYTLSGTIGQAEAGPVLSSGTTELTGGFWSPLVDAGRLCADVNGDGTITDSDFFAWVTAFVTNPQTPSSLVACDVNQDGNCTDSDFFAWVTLFVDPAQDPGNCPTLP